MKKIGLIALVCAAIWGCKNNEQTKSSSSQNTATTSSSQNQLTPEEEKDGWKLLFDGKSMAGWHNFKKTTIGKDWIVDSAEEAIALNAVAVEGKWQAKDGGDIVTDGEFENYELDLEWKIDTCGNSGVIFNVIEDLKDSLQYVWNSGPEMQVLDNKCHPDAKIIKHRAGDLYDLISCSKETVKPALMWNKAKLVINKGHLEQWLNGEKLVETQLWDKNWDALVAASKFKTMPMFGKAHKGHIALQDHGHRVWFRNVKIKELK